MPQEVNYRLKALLLEVVDNQMKDPHTPFVKEKFNQLRPKYGAARAKEMIAAVVIGELYDMQMNMRGLDDAKYRKLIEDLE